MTFAAGVVRRRARVPEAFAVRFAAVARFAVVRLAVVRLAVVRLAVVRFAVARFAVVRLAVVRLAVVRFGPVARLVAGLRPAVFRAAAGAARFRATGVRLRAVVRRVVRDGDVAVTRATVRPPIRLLAADNCVSAACSLLASFSAFFVAVAAFWVAFRCALRVWFTSLRSALSSLACFFCTFLGSARLAAAAETATVRRAGLVFARIAEPPYMN